MPPLRALPARLLPPSRWGAHYSLVHRGAATQGLAPTHTAAHTPRLPAAGALEPPGGTAEGDSLEGRGTSACEG